MLNQIYIHYINTLFVLESFIISCWLLKEKKNRYRNRNRPVCSKKIGIGIGHEKSWSVHHYYLLLNKNFKKKKYFKKVFLWLSGRALR